MLIVNRVSTKGHQVDASSGTVTAQKSTNAAAHVTPLGLNGTAASRERTAVGAALKTVTFSTGAKQVAISVYREAAFTPGTNVDDVYSFVFNAADDATATTLLALADSSSATVSHILIRANEQPRIVDFPSTSLCTRVDMIRVLGSVAHTVLVEAVQ